MRMCRLESLLGALGVVALGACGETVSPIPTVATIAPTKVLARDTGIVLTLLGTGLNPGVVVEIGGVPVVPLAALGTSLSAIIPSAAMLNPGTVEVVVVSGTNRSTSTSFVVEPAVRFVAVTGRALGGCALSDAGDAYCWGGVPFAKVSAPVTFTKLSSNPGEACGLAANGDMYCWPVNTRTAVKKTIPALVDISVGFTERCGVTSSGETWCWNGGEFPSPRRITTVPAFKKISSGTHQCGLTADGSAYCWGPDMYGRLGAEPGSPQPVAVSSTLRFTEIDAGQVHTCAIATTGASYCWGDNQYGELGVGDLQLYIGPKLVAGSHQFTSLIAGNLVSCGITAAKQGYCWGSNTQGILGLGSTTATVQATQPFLYFRVLSIASGPGISQTLGDQATTCAVTDDNKLYCWGFGVGITPKRMDPAIP